MGESQVTPADSRPEREPAAKLTGLTYRQLNEWDSRGLLPHTRTGKTGWRRVTKWQAISIRIVADLHSEFGIPLARLSRLRQWLSGEVPLPSGFGDFTAAGAISCLILPLGGGSDAEARNERGRIQSRLGRQLSRSRAEPAHAAQSVIEELVSQIAAGMTSRGWEDDQARDFASAALSLSAPGTEGARVNDQLYQLELEALASGDMGARQAVRLLASLLIPVSSAVMCAYTGFPSYFITNLTCGSFVIEPDLLETAVIGEDWARSIILAVTEHVNSVLAALGRETFPVTMRARDIQAIAPKHREKQEQAILDLLSDGADSLSRIVIEPKKNFYRVIREEEIDLESAEQVSDLVKQHDYQTIMLKVHGGKIVRATQAASERLEHGDPADDDR